jgi:hypothetical protein
VLGWDISRLSALADAFLSIDQSISNHPKNNPNQKFKHKNKFTNKINLKQKIYETKNK